MEYKIEFIKSEITLRLVFISKKISITLKRILTFTGNCMNLIKINSPPSFV
jgi:hypothetical protein